MSSSSRTNHFARAWPRLRGWLDDDADGQRILRHLSGASEAWASMGRPDTELYRGVRLRTTLDWRERTHPTLTSTERDFLAAARRHADAAARREHRTIRRLHGLVTAVAVLLVAALLAALLAIRQADRAEVAAVTADARLAAALARDADTVEQALLLAVEGVRLQDSRETRASLLAALTRSPALIGSYHHDTGRPPDAAKRLVAVRPDGEVLIASDGATAAVHDADTLDVVDTFDAPVQVAAYRPGGEQLAVSTHTVSASGPYDVVFDTIPVRLLNAATLEPESVQLGGWPAGRIQAWDLDYSADGRRLAAELCEMRDWWVWDFGCTATVWDLASPEHPCGASRSVVRGRLRSASTAACSTSGATRSRRSRSTTWRPVRCSARKLSPPTSARGQLPATTFDSLEISPDGTTVVVRDRNDIVVLDAHTLDRAEETHGPHGRGPSGRSSRTRHSPGVGRPGRHHHRLGHRHRLPGRAVNEHTDSVRALAFDPDDDTLYSAAEDQRLLVWDLRGNGGSSPARHVPRPGPGFRCPALLDWAAPPRTARRSSTSNNGVPNAVFPVGTLRFLDVAGGKPGEPIVTDHLNWGFSWRPGEFEELATADDEGFVTSGTGARGTLIKERRVRSKPSSTSRTCPTAARSWASIERSRSSGSTPTPWSRPASQSHSDRTLPRRLTTHRSAQRPPSQ